MESAGYNRGNAPWSARRRGQKELNLLHFAAGGTAEASATSTEVVGCKFADANLGGELLHDMPDELFRYSFAPNSTCATHPPEEAARANSCSSCPVIQQAPNPGLEWSERDHPFRAGPRLPSAPRAVGNGPRSSWRARADGVRTRAGGPAVPDHACPSSAPGWVPARVFAPARRRRISPSP